MKAATTKSVLTLMLTIVLLSCTAFAGTDSTSIPEEAETQEQTSAVSMPEQESNDSIAELEQESNDSIAELEQKSNDSIAEPEQESNDSIAELEQESNDSIAELEQESNDSNAELEQKLLNQVKKILPIILGISGDDPGSSKEWLLEQVKKLIKNPDQYSEDFWDSLFGTGADGISKEDDAETKGTILFKMELPEPVKMPDMYSVTYCRMDDKKNQVLTMLERDSDGNIHYLDGESEYVFVKTDEGFHMYPVLADQNGFGEWNGIILSARSVRSLTDHFWNCADQTFIKWLGAEFTEETEYLGRHCGLYHAEPGTITFTYHCDMVIDDETGICLCYTADELIKGAVFNITEDNTIEIDIGDYDIGGEEMDFYCTEFKTEDVSFEIPAE